MDYKLGDILECVELFSTDKSYINWDVKYKVDKQYPGRVIDEGDVYKIININSLSYEKLYIKEIAVIKSSIVYAETIPINVEQVDKYFKCKRIERKRKLDKIENASK